MRLFDREVQEHRRHLVNLSEVTHILSVSWFVLEVLVTMINHPIGWNNNNNNFLDNHPPTSLIGLPWPHSKAVYSTSPVRGVFY